MHHPRWFYVSAAVALALLHIWADSEAVSAQSESGVIEGRVTFSGTPPSPTMLTQDGDVQPVLYLDGSGGLRYAVVYLPDAPRSTAPLPPPVTLNQRRFIFEPQVLAVRAGQTVGFTNDDPANHNVRAQDANPANTFNINTAVGALGRPEHRFAPTPPGRALELSCDIHPWMAAWVYVFESDQFAVTSENGSFRIQNVAPGRHAIAVRQPAGPLARDLGVDVRAGETTRLDVRFTSSDIRTPVKRPGL
jgi:plastocyanin